MLEDTRIEMLNNSRVFAGLELPQIQGIIEASDERLFPEGETIMEEGGTEQSLWLLEDGEAEVFKIIRGDVGKTLAYVRPGEVLGELEFVGAGARAASAKTTMASKFLVLSPSSFAGLVGRDPRLAAVFYRNVATIVAERLRATNELYRSSVARGLESVGAAALNLHRLAEDLAEITVVIADGTRICGRILQLDQTPAGYSLVLKAGERGGIMIIPYHAVQAVELGQEVPQR